MPRTYVLPELKAIDLYRLTHDLTWEQLSIRLGRMRPPVHIPARTLNHLCTRRKPFRRPLRERTLFGIRRFLRSVRAGTRGVAA